MEKPISQTMWGSHQKNVKNPKPILIGNLFQVVDFTNRSQKFSLDVNKLYSK